MEYENRIKDVTNSFNSSLDKLRKENEGLKTMINEREAEIDKLEEGKDLQDKNEKNEVTDNESEELKKLNEQNKKLNEEIEELKKLLDAKRSRIDRMSRQKREEDQVIAKYKESVNDEINKLKELIKNKEEEAKNDVMKFKSKLEEYEEKIKSSEARKEPVAEHSSRVPKAREEGVPNAALIVRIEESERKFWIAIGVALLIAALAWYGWTRECL